MQRFSSSTISCEIWITILKTTKCFVLIITAIGLLCSCSHFSTSKGPGSNGAEDGVPGDAADIRTSDDGEQVALDTIRARPGTKVVPIVEDDLAGGTPQGAAGPDGA